MKVIFIDIDGPLAWETWKDGRIKIMEETQHEFTIPYPWVKEDCNALAKIIEKTNALLVVSSTWRTYYSFSQLKMIFEYYGIGRWNILDTTNHFNPMKKMSSSDEWNRACEIKTWVRTFKPNSWIAIDDMNLGMYFKQLKIPKWKHISVNGDWGNGGQLRNKTEECIKKLNSNGK